MKRTVMNLFALTLILGGAAHLSAQAVQPPVNFCCGSGGTSCCGANGCEAGPSGCSAW